MAGKADRRFTREELVLRVTLRVANVPPNSGTLIDLSVTGVRVQVNDQVPVGTECRVDIPALKFIATATVIRSEPYVTTFLIALKFNEPQDIIPGRILEYKVRQLRK